MAEQLLDGLQIPGGVEHPLAGAMASLVHPLTARLPFRDDPGAGEAAVPPVVGSVLAQAG